MLDFNREDSSRRVDELLAADMNEMSFAERNQVMEELHGVDDVIEENPEYVAASLRAMEIELGKIGHKPAYNQAFLKNPSYVLNPKWRLMFLRADSFQPERAATRLVKFMEAKLEMFGPDALTRTLYLRDLDKNTMEMFTSGVLQILPERSRSGKLVSVICPRPVRRHYDTLDSAVKILFYLITMHAEIDEESQKRGFMHVVFFPGTSMTQRFRAAQQRMGKMGDFLPMRLTGTHLCAAVNYFSKARYFVMTRFTKATRVRLRCHDGTVTECLYSLMTYGIPVHDIPLGNDSEVKNAAHVRWIAKQKVRDRRMAASGHFPGIDVPGVSDVLLGRGRNLQDHSGNVQMRNLIGVYLDDYEQGTSSERDRVRAVVIQQVKHLGGRFLTRNSDGWFEVVPDDNVFEKMGRSFRTMVSTSKKMPPKERIQFVQTMECKRARILIPSTEEGLCTGCF